MRTRRKTPEEAASKKPNHAFQSYGSFCQVPIRQGVYGPMLCGLPRSVHPEPSPDDETGAKREGCP